MRPLVFAVALFALASVDARASASMDAWFGPPGGDWDPGSTVLTKMKKLVNAGLLAALDKHADPARAPRRYWFQYRGRTRGADRSIDFIGHPFPVDPAAAGEYLDVTVPELCTVTGSYSPRTGTLSALSVTAINCPRHTH